MRPGIFYLPEYHNFSYIARVPWPHICEDYQQDWVHAIDTMEQWLTRCIGSHYSEWAYAEQADQNYWEACIAFRKESYKTLFLITWS
jgi:hypothetical protein